MYDSPPSWTQESSLHASCFSLSFTLDCLLIIVISKYCTIIVLDDS